ncbi:MAG: PAS domain-containing protein [Isosphaeraceae bacterium]
MVLIFERVHAAWRLSEERAAASWPAEEAQRRETRLYLSVLNSMVDGVIAYDTEGHLILRNRGLERMLGPTDPERSIEDELKLLEPFHSDGATPIRPEDMPIRRALRGEATDEREILLRRPGSRETRVIAKTARPLLDEQGGVQGAIAIIRDITSQKLAEAEIRAGHERFRRFIDQIPILTWIKGEDGRFEHVNPAYARLFGAPVDQIIGKTSRDLFPDEEAERHRAEDMAVLASNEVLRIDEAVTLPDGSRAEYLTYKFVLPGSGEQRQVAGAAVEVTEQRRAEQAMRETDERLDFALETSHVGAWELDLVDHSAFRSLEHDRIFGYESLLPRWTYEMFLEHVLPEDRALVDEKHRMAIATRADWSFECRIRRVDGAIRWIWAAGRPRVDPDGIPRRMAGIVQDITERKEVEAALAESEARFQAFMDHSPVLAWIKDQDGRFVYANRRFLTDFQVRSEDLIGKGDFDFWPREIAESYRAADRDAIDTGGPVEAVERFPVREEDRIWWKIKFPMATSDGRRLVGGIGIDLTARVRAEQALADSEARFRNVLDRSPTIVYIKDLQRRYQFVNRRCADLWGTEPQDWVGRTAEELVPAATAEQFRLHDERVLERGESFTVEEAFVTPGGEARTSLSTQFPLRDAQGTITSICGISLDITDRKQAEQAVLESEARFQAFMDNSPAAAWIKDEDGRVVYYNHIVLRGLSLHLEDVVGRPESELFPAWADAFRENDLRVLESGVPEQVIEQVEPRIGHRRTMLNVKFPIHHGNGKRLIGGIGIDITERVQAEEALRTLNAELERRVAERAAELAKLVTILDASTDFIATANPRGETIWANRAITKALGGHGPDGNITMIRDGHPPDSARKVVEEGLPTAARDGHWLGETELLTPDGAIIPVSQLIMVHRDEDGRPAFFSPIMRDITGQKRLEKKCASVRRSLAAQRRARPSVADEG